MSMVAETLTDQDEVEARIQQALLFDARDSMEDTERNMHQLASALCDSERYPHVGHFLIRYFPVTTDVSEEKDNNNFRRPDVIDSAVVDFFHTCKDPIKAAILEGDTSSLWAEFAHDAAIRDEDQATQFFRGAYTHIANGPDLPSVLARHGLPMNYFADYFFTVGKILRARGREYAQDYVDGHPITQEAVALSGDVFIRAIRLRSWIEAYAIKAAMDEDDHDKVAAIQERIEERTRRELKVVIPAAKMTIRAAEWSDKKVTAASSKISELLRRRRWAKQAA